MTDFDYDVYQKKSLARGARNRKCGSKTRYVSLPHDNMTKKQWKEKCGPMITYKESELRNTMTYQRFKELPTEAQQEYLNRLRGEFRVSDAQISAMMGVKQNTFSYHCKSYGLVRRELPDVTAAEKKLAKEHWESFLAGSEPHGEEAADVVEKEPHGEEQVAEEDSVAECAVEHNESNNEGEKHTMRMDNMRLVFTGDINVDAVANSLRFILGDNRNGELTIIFTDSNYGEKLPF